MTWQQEFAAAQETKTANLICLKWGTLYSAGWVNKLYGMVSRNTTWNLRFVCLTDDPAGIRSEVECKPLPAFPPQNALLRWRKPYIYSNPLHDLTGMTLFLDLDLLVTGNIDRFFTYSGRFCLPRVWRPDETRMRWGNTSVVRFFIGHEAYLLDALRSEPIEDFHAKYKGLEQRFVSDHVREISFFPDEWCVYFKDCLPRNYVAKFFSEPKAPKEASIVIFQGAFTPESAVEGRINPKKIPEGRRRFSRHLTRRFKPADWIKEAWAE